MNLRHLQECLPWSIAYSTAFMTSNGRERHRSLMHDVLHVMKGLGRIAAVCEKIDHGKPHGMTIEQLADEVTDLVVCALHMANTNPIGKFDLEAAVIAKIEKRNGIMLPSESGICGATMTGKNQRGESFSVGPCILRAGHAAHDGRPDSHTDGSSTWGG